MKGQAEQFKKLLQDAVDRAKNRVGVCFIVTGLGGGTGSGASPVIAELCKQIVMLEASKAKFSSIDAVGLPTYIVATTPRYEDGRKKREVCSHAIEKLQKVSRGIILMDNNSLLNCRNLTVEEEYNIIDSSIADAVQSLHEIITSTPRENADLNDFIKITGVSVSSQEGEVAPQPSGQLLLMGMSKVQLGESSQEGSTPVAELDARGLLNDSIKADLRRLVEGALNSNTILYKNLNGVGNVLFHVLTGKETSNFSLKNNYMKGCICRMAGKHLGEIDFSTSGGDNEEMKVNEVQLILVATHFKDVTPLIAYEDSLKREQERIAKEAEEVLLDEKPTRGVPEPAQGGAQLEDGDTHKLLSAYHELQGKVMAVPSAPTPSISQNRVAATSTPSNVERITGGANLFSDTNNFRTPVSPVEAVDSPASGAEESKVIYSQAEKELLDLFRA